MINDFTKTELREIYRCLQYMIKGDFTPYSCLTMSLKSKIHSMIDNYCEHKYLEFFGDVLSYNCTNCNLRFNYDDISKGRYVKFIPGAK